MAKKHDHAAHVEIMGESAKYLRVSTKEKMDNGQAIERLVLKTSEEGKELLKGK